MWVTIEQGPAAGRELEVSDRIVIGRDPACDLVLDDDQVSRRHAVMQADASTVILQDLGSTNGTWVDGQRIDGPVRLSGKEGIGSGPRGPGRPPRAGPSRPAFDQTRPDLPQTEASSSAAPHAGLGAAAGPPGPSDFPADPPPPPAPAPVQSVPVPPPVAAAPQAVPRTPIGCSRWRAIRPTSTGVPGLEWGTCFGSRASRPETPVPGRRGPERYPLVAAGAGRVLPMGGCALGRAVDHPPDRESGLTPGTDHHYALRLAKGAVVRISGSEREGVQPKHSDGPAGSATLPITLAKLGSIIQTQITERGQFPLVARAINRGQDVRFGPLDRQCRRGSPRAKRP